MKLHLKKRYYKTSRRGREPIRYSVRQPRGVGTDIYGEVRIASVLRKRKNKDLRKALMRHEIAEIRKWGKGGKATHSEARKREPKLTRGIGGVSGFWKEIKRRERNG